MTQCYGLPAKCGSSQLKPEVAASGLPILRPCYGSKMLAKIQEILSIYRHAQRDRSNKAGIKDEVYTAIIIGIKWTFMKNSFELN